MSSYVTFLQDISVIKDRLSTVGQVAQVKPQVPTPTEPQMVTAFQD